MSDQCHECVWIINKLNQEFFNLLKDYKKLEKENDLLKNEYKSNHNNKIILNEMIIYKDYNYHRVSLN